MRMTVVVQSALCAARAPTYLPQYMSGPYIPVPEKAPTS